MPLSNAERQKRYRQRLKAAARTGDDLLARLNRAYEEGCRSAINEALERIRAREDGSEVRAEWASWEDALAALPPHEQAAGDWIEQARQSGAKLGEHLVMQARHDCLMPLAAKRREARELQDAAQQKARRSS